MPQYIFTEDEWMQFRDESHGHTLLAIDQTTYRSIKMGGMTDRLPGSETYDRLLGVNVFKPGGIYEAHAHQTPMYYYVIAGEGIMRVGDEERVVGKGAWIYTPPGLKHYTENTGDEDFAYLFFGGNPTDADAGFHEPVKGA